MLCYSSETVRGTTYKLSGDSGENASTSVEGAEPSVLEILSLVSQLAETPDWQIESVASLACLLSSMWEARFKNLHGGEDIRLLPALTVGLYRSGYDRVAGTWLGVACAGRALSHKKANNPFVQSALDKLSKRNSVTSPFRFYLLEENHQKKEDLLLSSDSSSSAMDSGTRLGIESLWLPIEFAGGLWGAWVMETASGIEPLDEIEKQALSTLGQVVALRCENAEALLNSINSQAKNGSQELSQEELFAQLERKKRLASAVTLPMNNGLSASLTAFDMIATRAGGRSGLMRLQEITDVGVNGVINTALWTRVLGAVFQEKPVTTSIALYELLNLLVLAVERQVRKSCVVCINEKALARNGAEPSSIQGIKIELGAPVATLETLVQLLIQQMVVDTDFEHANESRDQDSRFVFLNVVFKEQEERAKLASFSSDIRLSLSLRHGPLGRSQRPSAMSIEAEEVQQSMPLSTASKMGGEVSKATIDPETPVALATTELLDILKIQSLKLEGEVQLSLQSKIDDTPKVATRKTVLVVDDDHQVRAVMVRLLRHAGYAVMAAACAEEALAMLVDCVDINLVLLDWILPDSADNLKEELRLRHPNTALLVSSGMDLSYQYGDKYLRKPFDRATLLEKIESSIKSESK